MPSEGPSRRFERPVPGLGEGLRVPGPVREEGNRLVQVCHWTVRAGPAAAVVGWLVSAWGFTRLIHGTGTAGPWLLLLLPSVALCLAGIMAHIFYGGRWEMDAATGIGRLFVRGWPVTRSVTFHMRAITRVVLIRMEAADPGRFRGKVGLKIADEAGRAAALALADYADANAAEGVVQFLSTWLQAKIEEHTLSSAAVLGPKPLVADFAVPSRPVGECHPTVRASRLAYNAKAQRLAFTAGPVERMALGIITVIYVALFLGSVVLTIIASGSGDAAPGLCFAAFFTITAIAVLACWRFLDLCVFDGKGRIVWLRRGWFGRLKPIPFGDMAGVQILYGGRLAALRHGNLPVFELNLVLKTGRRQNLYVTARTASLRSNAANIARFVGVPMVDQTLGL